MAKEITNKSLKRFNVSMGILHFIQAMLMLFFALSIDKIKDFTLPVMSNYLTFDVSTKSLVSDPQKLFDMPFAICVAIFLFLSALAHFIISAPKSNDIYNDGISKGINVFRWYEYALSSSIMIVLISLLFGIYDIGALIAIFTLNASMNLFGLLMEKMNQYTKKTNWTPFIFGSIAGIVPWVIVVMHAFGNSNPADIPWFVYAILISYFIFFNLFPVNMILQYKKIGKWKDYIYGEKVYITLSLVAKSVLAWLVFFGVMQPK